MKQAAVFGATGAVGKRLVEALNASSDFSKIILLGRRNAEDLPVSEKIEQHIIDFDNLDQSSEMLRNTDVSFCTLGTTRAKSGNAGFYKVDHDYVLNAAKAAKKEGVDQFVLVTAVGSDPNSMFFYPKTKGEVERDVAALGFKKLLIIRPAFLERGSFGEFRPVESLLKIFIAPLKLISNSVAISTENVSKAMIVGALDDSLTGKVIWENAELLKKAKLFKAPENAEH